MGERPGYRARFSRGGSSGAEFARFVAQERQRWKPVIPRAKIKPD